MATKMQCLHVVVIALMATHLVSSVSSSRLLLQSKSTAAAEAASGEHQAPSNQKFHNMDFQQLSGGRTTTEKEVTSYDYGYQKLSAAKTSSSSETPTTESTDPETTTAPYFPDYETHDNSPGFNGRRR